MIALALPRTAGDAYLSVDQLLLALLGSSDVSAALQEAGTTRQQIEDAIKQVGAGVMHAHGLPSTWPLQKPGTCMQAMHAQHPCL
jgi:hypothetical protein